MSDYNYNNGPVYTGEVVDDKYNGPGSEYNINNNQPNNEGNGAATASLVLGILSVLAWFLGYGAIISAILGIIGLICASVSKKAGNTSGVRTAGFVLSLLGTIIGTIIFLSCLACAITSAGLTGCMALEMATEY